MNLYYLYFQIAIKNNDSIINIYYYIYLNYYKYCFLNIS